MKLFWLRMGHGRTGVEMRLLGQRLCLGVRWSRRVPVFDGSGGHAPRGPYIEWTPTWFMLNARGWQRRP